MTSYIKIGDALVDASKVAPPDRRFRDAWMLDAKGVIVLDQAKLAAVRARYRAEIDAEAEAQRLRYITHGAGQALEYREVAAEALAYAADPSGEYPLLQASVDAGEAADLAAAAALVTDRHKAWRTLGAMIRRVRLTAKRAIDAAATIEEAAAARDAVRWE